MTLCWACDTILAIHVCVLYYIYRAGAKANCTCMCTYSAHSSPSSSTLPATHIAHVQCLPHVRLQNWLLYTKTHILLCIQYAFMKNEYQHTKLYYTTHNPHCIWLWYYSSLFTWFLWDSARNNERFSTWPLHLVKKKTYLALRKIGASSQTSWQDNFLTKRSSQEEHHSCLQEQLSIQDSTMLIIMIQSTQAVCCRCHNPILC